MRAVTLFWPGFSIFLAIIPKQNSEVGMNEVQLN